MTVLEARDVTKVFREGSETVAVLNGASLSLDRGEIVALEGPSGSGKTTFLTILGCMLTPSSGRVRIEGREVDPDPSGPPARVPPRLDRVRVPAVQSVPGADRGGERRVRAEPQGNQGGRTRGARPPACSTRWGLPTGPVSCRATSPADRSSAWRSPGPGRPSADPPGRRADRQPRLSGRLADPGSCSASSPNARNRALLIVTHDPKVRHVADRVVRIRDGIIAN